MKVKICGLTNYEDAELAVKSGADYIGFIFAESPRKADTERVAAILHELENNNLRNIVKAVGVFVNEKKETIESIIEKTGIDIAQIHGDETYKQTNEYSFPWYKAIRISSNSDVDEQIVLNGFMWKCPLLLIDTKVEGIYGGTGKALALDIVNYAKERVKETGKDFFLGGGITSENVFDILKKTEPDGIDIGSGIEEIKGKKSPERVKMLFEEIKKFKKE